MHHCNETSVLHLAHYHWVGNYQKITYLQDEGLNVFFLYVTKCAAIEVAVISTKENDLIVDTEGATYGG